MRVVTYSHHILLVGLKEEERYMSHDSHMIHKLLTCHENCHVYIRLFVCLLACLLSLILLLLTY